MEMSLEQYAKYLLYDADNNKYIGPGHIKKYIEENLK